MEVTMLLCDHAQVAGGKLYVLGGGWNQVAVPNTPFPAALAVLMQVPWTSTNEKHNLRIQLVDDDSNQVEVEGNPILIEGQFEVGRPPGIKAGSSINEPMVFKFGGLPLDPGGYVFELSVSDTVLARAPFRVNEG